MSFNAKVGSFAARTTAGSQSISGLGFTPKAVLFWAVSLTADGAGSGTAMPGTVLGMTDGVTSCCCANLDDFTGGNPWLDPSNCISLVDHNDNGLTASCSALDSDGFTLAWTAPGTGQAAWIVNYLALGGSDLSAKILNTSWSANGASPTMSGAGFTPVGGIFVSGPLADPTFYGGAFTGFGAGIGVGINQPLLTTPAWISTATFGGTTPGRNTFLGTAPIRILGSSAGAAANASQAIVQTWQSDGLQLFVNQFNSAVFPSGITSVSTYVLLLAGCKLWVNQLAQQAASPGFQQVGGANFVPSAALFSSYGRTANSTTIDTAAAYRSIGASDGTNRGVTATSRGSFGNAYLDRSKTIVAITDASPQTQPALGDLHTRFDYGGYGVEWSAADATARITESLSLGPLDSPALSNYQLVQPIVHGKFT